MSLSIRRARVFAGVACSMLSVAVAGCAAAAPDADVADDDESALEESRTVELALATEGDGLEVTDEPRLKAGARSKLECAAPFVADGGKRYACRRGSERLELLLRGDDATLLYKNGSAKREYFACTGSSPTLRCTSKKPSRGQGGGLSSPFASTVAGVSIPNAHALDGASLLVRGMAPRTPQQYDELQAAGVEAVLLFKNATGNGSDVADELAELEQRGFTASRVKHIPFKWKDLTSFQASCEETVDALKFLKARERAGQKTFFHCTVGEDRTGLLAAVARLVRAPEADPSALFHGEMCERGYGEGNPLKPFTVTRELEHGLTPLYRKLAHLIRSGALTASRLDPAACESEPASAELEADEALAANRYRCGTSTQYVP